MGRVGALVLYSNVKHARVSLVGSGFDSRQGGAMSARMMTFLVLGGSDYRKYACLLH